MSPTTYVHSPNKDVSLKYLRFAVNNFQERQLQLDVGGIEPNFAHPKDFRSKNYDIMIYSYHHLCILIHFTIHLTVLSVLSTLHMNHAHWSTHARHMGSRKLKRANEIDTQLGSPWVPWVPAAQRICGSTALGLRQFFGSASQWYRPSRAVAVARSNRSVSRSTRSTGHPKNIDLVTWWCIPLLLSPSVFSGDEQA